MSALPETLSDVQRHAVWLAQYRFANARLSHPQPDSACVALAAERVSAPGQAARAIRARGPTDAPSATRAKAREALDPFARIWRINAALAPDDAEPVKKYVAGLWPTMGDARRANAALAALATPAPKVAS